jgi:hypothetical protein
LRRAAERIKKAAVVPYVVHGGAPVAPVRGGAPTPTSCHNKALALALVISNW